MAKADGDEGHRRRRQRTKRGSRFCVELAVAEVARMMAARGGEEYASPRRRH